MRRAFAVLVLAIPLALGCGGRTVGPPPASPALTRGADALPADLDLVVRLDLRRVQSALGPELVRELRRAAELSSGKDGTEALVARMLEQADVLLLGVRPRLAASLDHVLVLEGRFSGFDPSSLPAEPRWRQPEDLGGDVRRWDRRALPGRGAPARIYAWSDRVIVLASAVEIDSTERAVELGEREGAVVPPSKGVLSFAARTVPLVVALEERSPELARILSSAQRLEGSAEIDATGIHVDLALEVDGPETAHHLRDLLEALSKLLSLKRSTAEIASSARFDVAGSYVTCRLDVPRAAISRWLQCTDGEPCAW